MKHIAEDLFALVVSAALIYFAITAPWPGKAGHVLSAAAADVDAATPKAVSRASASESFQPDPLPCIPPDVITVSTQAVVDDPTSGTVTVTLTKDLPSTFTVVLPIGPITVGQWWCTREALRAQTQAAQRQYRLAKLAEETYLREEDVFFAVGDVQTGVTQDPKTRQ